MLTNTGSGEGGEPDRVALRERTRGSTISLLYNKLTVLWGS